MTPAPRTLTAALARHAAERPGQPAVVIPGGERLSFADLAARAARVAGALRAAGLGPGDRLAYLGREDAAYWELLYGAARLGAVLVPVNARLAPAEIAHILADSAARLVFLDPDRAADPGGAVRLGAEYAAWRDAAEPLAEAAPATGDTPLAQLYTSGTTGLPKGVVLGHRSCFAIAEALAGAGLDWIDWREGDVALVGIPGFHVGGLWYATQALNAGATIVSLPAYSAAAARAAIAAEGVSCAIFVPAMLRSLLAEPGVTAAEFSRLRKVVYGGAPISPGLLEQSARVLGCEFAQIYGLTETGNTAICLPPAEHRPGSPRLLAAGRPYPGIGVRITGEDGRELPVGETGEVWLRTPAAMLEYWGLPEATAETLVDGWVRTGDAGALDADGFLFIRDRVKDLILVGGENVFPAEVELALLRHPEVRDAAVIGVPDERSGEAVLAHLVLGPGAAATTRDIALFLREHLADFKRPSRFRVLAEIPRNPSGKILRRELRDEYWRGRERRVN